MEFSILNVKASVIKSSNLSQEQIAILEELSVNMSRDGIDRNSPMRYIFARLGDRWCMLLLQILRAGPLRSLDLRRLTSSLSHEGVISQRMFTLKIRELEACGLVERRIIETNPIGVDYYLTQLGQSLVLELDNMMNWVRKNYINGNIPIKD